MVKASISIQYLTLFSKKNTKILQELGVLPHQSQDEIHFLCLGQRSDCVVEEHWKQLCV